MAEGEPVAILNHNKPTAYLIPAETYKAMIGKMEDFQLGLLDKKRRNKKMSALEISLDEL